MRYNLQAKDWKEYSIAFKSITGSHSYGLNIATSDIDKKGIFVIPNEDILLDKYFPQIQKSKDETHYEILRFLQLLQTANPTVLELLFVEDRFVEQISPEFEILRKERHKFLTKKCKDSFGGYAAAQIKKSRGLNKKFNWESSKITKKDPIEFCYVEKNGKTIPLETLLGDFGYAAGHSYVGLVGLEHMSGCYSLYLDEGYMTFTPPKYKGIFEGGRIVTSSIPKEAKSIGVMSYNENAYKIHCKDWESYQTWLRERNETRFVETKNHSQKIDGKHMMHTVRLLTMALEIPELNDLRVYRKDREKLLAIRRGEVNLDEILTEAEISLKRLDVYDSSSLPESVDPEFVTYLLKQFRKI